jgi:hypothetical protein
VFGVFLEICLIGISFWCLNIGLLLMLMLNISGRHNSNGGQLPAWFLVRAQL